MKYEGHVPVLSGVYGEDCIWQVPGCIVSIVMTTKAQSRYRRLVAWRRTTQVKADNKKRQGSVGLTSVASFISSRDMLTTPIQLLQSLSKPTSTLSSLYKTNPDPKPLFTQIASAPRKEVGLGTRAPRPSRLYTR